MWCYDFAHRGRLDLTGDDVALANRVARMAESFSRAGERTHLSLHVSGSVTGAAPRTVLSLSVSSPPPPEWRRDPRAGISREVGSGLTTILERRSYVRTSQGVARTLRATGFAEGAQNHALEGLCERLSWLTVSLHALALPSARAQRVTSRAVHRVGTDAQFTRGAGFRWSARQQRGLEILRHRELAVASGAALCRWALYVVVCAPTLAVLKERVEETLSCARSGGLRLESGVGVQYEWLIFQLPGGPGW